MKKISEVKHYKIRKDGSLRFVGIEHVEVEEHHWGHIKLLDIRDKADERRLAYGCAEVSPQDRAASVSERAEAPEDSAGAV